MMTKRNIIKEDRTESFILSYTKYFESFILSYIRL